jgi:hypothetical protein
MGNKDSSNNQKKSKQYSLSGLFAVLLWGLSLILTCVNTFNYGNLIWTQFEFDWIALILIGVALFSKKLTIPRNIAMSINGIGILIPIYRIYRVLTGAHPATAGVLLMVLLIIITGILVYVKLFSDNKSESQTIPSVTSEAIPKETQTEAKAESTTDQALKNDTSKYQPMSIENWIVTYLIMIIPIVNIVMLFVWGFGDNTQPSKANWAKATLIWFSIFIVLYLVFFGAIIRSVF